jgi:hypothetical protein
MVVSEIGAADAVRDQLVDVIAAPAVALGAFDAEHVELAFDVAEDEIGAGHRAMLSRFPVTWRLSWPSPLFKTICSTFTAAWSAQIPQQP